MDTSTQTVLGEQKMDDAASVELPDASITEKEGNQVDPQYEKHLRPIPQSQRRGLCGCFTIIPEVADRYEYRNGTKWIITIITVLAPTTSSVGSSAFFSK